MCCSQFDSGKMYTYLKGYLHGANLTESLRALSFARECHMGQLRKSGEAYVTHPLTMACNAVSMGNRDDVLIATILLHDVCEDCGVDIAELPVCEEVRKNVDLLTFRIMENETKEDAKKRYFDHLLDSREATLAKLIDRCHNVSTMAGTFTLEKTKAYIEETREYILPLLKVAKSTFTDDSDMLFSLKYHILSVVDSVDAMCRILEEKQTA